MPYTYDKLRGRIVEKYKSQTNFSKAVGLSRQAVTNKMTGRWGFSQEDIVKWSGLLDIKESEYAEYFFA